MFPAGPCSQRERGQRALVVGTPTGSLGAWAGGRAGEANREEGN